MAKLGDIGPLKVVSESSIGSNIRRIEAVSGVEPVRRLRRAEQIIDDAADRLGVPVDELLDGIDRRLAEIKGLRHELKEFKRDAATGRAGELAGAAVDGIVVARVDGLDQAALRDLAVAVREQPGIRGVVLGSAPRGGRCGVGRSGHRSRRARRRVPHRVGQEDDRRGWSPSSRAGDRWRQEPHALDEALDQAREAAGVA